MVLTGIRLNAALSSVNHSTEIIHHHHKYCPAASGWMAFSNKFVLETKEQNSAF